MTIMIGMSDPFTKKSDKRLALMNEFFCLMVNYHLLIFSDWVPDGPARGTMGYVLISITVVNIVINLTVMGVYSVSGVGRIAMLRYKRCKVFQAHGLKMQKAAKDKQAAIKSRL